MSAIAVMARFIEEEMQARGVRGLTRDDYVEILRATIDRTAQAAEEVVTRAAKRQYPREPA